MSYLSLGHSEMAGDQNPIPGIYMPTANFWKTSSDALRTFKSSGASCYSGVPCFVQKPGTR